MSVDMVFTRQLSPNLTTKTCLICCITLKTVKSVIIYGIAVQIMIFQSGKHKYNTIPPWNSPYYAWFPLASHIVGCSSLVNINIQKCNTIPPWNSPYYAWFPLASHIVGCSSLVNINITLYHLGTVPTMLGSY